MSRSSSSTLLFALLSGHSFLSACALEEEGAEQALEDGADPEAERALHELGVDTKDFYVKGDQIGVGDVVLNRDELMRGGYAWLKRHKTDDKSHAVSTTPPVTALNAASIKLAFATGTRTPTTQVRNAFISAAGDYNSTCSAASPNNCGVYISQNNAGPAITVYLYFASEWHLSGCQSTQVACSQFPASGAPGTYIHVKDSLLKSGCPTWTAAAIAHVARHELGHAIGFNHPGVGWLLPETESQVPTPATTIMNELAMDAACNFTPTVLQTDDKKGLRYLY